jgi:RNAse (barnase) inhibitor barstar
VQLDIPDYFGHNLDALEEVLADLEWVTENVCIIILNHKALLSDAMDKKIDFLDILQQCENEKVQVVIAN